MKKILLPILFLSIFLSVTPALAAPDIGTGAGGLAQRIGRYSGFSTNVTEYTLSETIGRVIKVILTFVGTIFFALSVYAGFLWMTAQGNDEQVGKAKKILTTGTIGMIVVVASYSITAFVMIMLARTTTF